LSRPSMRAPGPLGRRVMSALADYCDG
jgi:hypothetical protein